MNVRNTPEEGKFFFLMPSLEYGPELGVVFENVKQLLSPPRLILRPNEGGFPPLAEKPRLVYDPAKGVIPKDLEAGFSGYWLISERLHRIFSAVDPAGFSFVECDFRMADGNKGPRYFLCDVVRVLDALDEENSEVEIEVDEDFVNGKYYDFTGGAKLAFRKDVTDGSHVFILKYSGDSVFCDRLMRNAVKEAVAEQDGGLSGLWFRDASNWKSA
ncbi:DUF1629 domain-containing protein [Xanthomonas sp. NCPPB 1638]|uniref:DUF1629 domain-containing protein n=1 Tax=Xanthomonas TaxID=338 RepID=UPI00132F3185|nr:DUF1629 domain-containing protein [Xanthomonas cucurbitae]QHG87134.1 DUF1629 domain-containing protein [Xanthomonas cucurbitae]WDM77058.1 DUF1629 domain-containing protein [Xanthomonas cucurbitae]